MNDHNLDDLIIDNMEPKNGKTKSILTIIALLIVVLIVAIILTKIILKDPNAEQLAFEESHTEMISPELTLQNATQEKAPKEETKLSTIIESEPKAPVKTPEVKQEEIVKKEEVIKKTEPIKEVVEITKEFTQTPTAPKVEPVVKQSVEEIQEKIVKVKEPKKEVAKSLPARILEKAKERPTGKPVNVPTPKATTTQAYYIQVGSFTQTPSTRFLSIIKNSGFNYKITSPTSSGTKKLLIGPYKDRKSADTALVRVKDRINKSAFVVKK